MGQTSSNVAGKAAIVNSKSESQQIAPVPKQNMVRQKLKLEKQPSMETKKKLSPSPSPQQHVPRKVSSRYSAPASLQRKQSDQTTAPTYSPLGESQKTLIRECWAMPNRQEVGSRIYKRVFSKREDVRRFYLLMEQQLGARTIESQEQRSVTPTTPEIPEDSGTGASLPGGWLEEAKNFTQLLDKIITNIDQHEYMEEVAFDWGRQFMKHRDCGFKPNYWIPFSEAITTECMYLDQATHSPGEAIDAWSSFVTIILGRMRDGYYYELRTQRQTARRSHSRQASFYSGSSNVSNDSGECDPV